MADERTPHEETAGENLPHFTEEAPPDEVHAWEQVDTGRYMPRRIKGSCKGRALG